MLSLRLSMLHFPIDRVHQDLCGPRFGYSTIPLVRPQPSHDVSAPTNLSCSSPRVSSLRTLDICADVDETSGLADSSARKNSIDEVVAISQSGYLETLSIEDLTERQRRAKIGLANRGKVPWNKGKPHSAETRELIKQRTIEALKNPKVRERRAECPRFHSEQVKTKIGSSQRRVWAKRLKWKRSRAKFLNSWSESIGEAARTGGPGQEALHWDSYDKIKQELTQRQVDLAVEKQKAKELARLRREQRPVTKRAVTHFKKPVRKRKSHEERRREKEELAKAKRELRQERRDSRRRLKLKERLSRIRRKISNTGQVPSTDGIVTSSGPAWDNFDIELIKRESSLREVSLADQIRAAKNKKAELATAEALASSLTVPSIRPKP